MVCGLYLCRYLSVLGGPIGLVHGSMQHNFIDWEGGAAIARALQHVPLLTQLEYVVGEGASPEAAGCVG